MKVKHFSELTEDEWQLYHQSRLCHLACADYRYCDIHLAYYKEYFGQTWSDESLVVFDKSGFYVCIFFFSNGRELSFFGSPCHVFYDDAMPRKELIQAFGELFVKIDQLKESMEGNVALLFYENPFFLLRYYEQEGVTFTSKIVYESTIDLLQSETDIRMGIRKSYKSLINWGQKNLDIKLFDSSNMSDEVMTEFELFHIAVSKRRTRSHESWMLQSKAVQCGKGFVVMGYLEEKLVTATLVLNGETECYYGVCVNDRELMAQKLPIGHYGLFKSILVAKEKGFEKFNFGDVGNNEDPKVNAIVKYKRGFSNLLQTKIVCKAVFMKE